MTSGAAPAPHAAAANYSDKISRFQTPGHAEIPPPRKMGLLGGHVDDADANCCYKRRDNNIIRDVLAPFLTRMRERWRLQNTYLATVIG